MKSRSTTTLGLSTMQKLWVECWLIDAVSEDGDVLLFLPYLEIGMWFFEKQKISIDTLSQRYIQEYPAYYNFHFSRPELNLLVFC